MESKSDEPPPKDQSIIIDEEKNQKGFFFCLFLDTRSMGHGTPVTIPKGEFGVLCMQLAILLQNLKGVGETEAEREFAGYV